MGTFQKLALSMRMLVSICVHFNDCAYYGLRGDHKKTVKVT